MKLSRYDRIDEDDNLLGGTASYDDVHGKGLWHRGVHVIIYTPEKQIVMQQRSPSLKYHPGEIEVSVGGGVDAGETPEQAVRREIKEELGITIAPKDVQFLGKAKFNHRTKTQINRVFIYSYAVCIPDKNIRLKINPEETTGVFLISEQKLRRALKVHRIKHIGKISATYTYWKYLLDSIT